MISWVRERVGAWRRARRERLLAEYGDYSDAERRELEGIRAEHDPLDELARSRAPGSANVGRWNESDFNR